MIHEMRLNDKPFNLIKQGTKNIELRLYDEKRKLLNEKDIIVFKNRSTDEELKVEVIKLHKYPNFKNFINILIKYN